MEITTQFAELADVKTDWLILPVWEDEPWGEAGTSLDARMEGALTRLVQTGDITGKAKAITTWLDCGKIAPQRLLLIGIGKRGRAERGELLACAAAAARAVTSRAHTHLAMAVPEPVPGLGAEEFAASLGLGLMQGCASPGLRKTKLDRYPPQEICLVAPPSALAQEIQRGAQRAAVEGQAIALARELVNTPPCDLYPETFAARAEQVARDVGVACTILEEQQLEA